MTIGAPIRTATLLAAFWLVLSGHYTPLYLIFGVVSVAVVCWLVQRADLRSGDDAALSMALRLAWFLPWLAKEVLVSSVVVARVVWSPRLRLSPAVEVAPARELSVLAQVLYANSITLTPGTLSLHLDDDGVEVHALQADGLETLLTGRMLGRVRRFEAAR